MIDNARSQLKQLILYVLIATVFGWIFGTPMLGALVGSFLWALQTIYWSEKVLFWAKGENNSVPPDAPGPLGSLAGRIAEQARNAKRTEEMLEARINRFQQSSAALSDALVIVDSEGNAEWWNEAGKELLGLRDIDRSQPIINVMRHPQFVSYFRAQSHTKPLTLTYSISGARKTVEYRVHDFGEGDKVLVARDITQLTRVDEMRQTFVANASHELRTPLTVIHGYLETLQDMDIPEHIKRPLASMHQQSVRMNNLVSDLLTLSKIETSNEANLKSAVNLTAMIEQIHQEAIALSGENAHRFELNIDPSIDLYGNRSEIHSALSNLVFNAVRYTPPGGHINISCVAQGLGANFSVTDTGIGIPTEDIPRLTERFYRVDSDRSRDTGGTGLGLAIVKHILARHNSTLGISSTMGEGSRFSCTFPAKRIVRKEASQI